MRLNELSNVCDSKKGKKRVGRGSGSGHGKTSCRGSKGYKSRSGSNTRPGFEGGQMPLLRRVPKVGFKNPFKKKYAIVNVGDLNKFESGILIDECFLSDKGFIKNSYDGVKILGNGDINISVTIRANKVSRVAKEKIERIGGKIEIV